MSDTEKTFNLTLNDVTAILREHGITMSVGACGCCSSPWVYFEYEGRVFDKDEADFDTRSAIACHNCYWYSSSVSNEPSTCCHPEWDAFGVKKSPRPTRPIDHCKNFLGK